MSGAIMATDTTWTSITYGRPTFIRPPSMGRLARGVVRRAGLTTATTKANVEAAWAAYPARWITGAAR